MCYTFPSQHNLVLFLHCHYLESVAASNPKLAEIFICSSFALSSSFCYILVAHNAVQFEDICRGAMGRLHVANSRTGIAPFI